MALANAGVQLFGGAGSSCDEAVNALLANKLNFNPEYGDILLRGFEDIHCAG